MTLSQADIDSLLGPQPADSVESLLDAPITGEDISLAMQDPAYKPSVDDYLKYEEYTKNKQTDWINTIAQSVDAAAGMIGGAISQGAQGAIANPLNYIEGAAQGTRQLYGLVAQSQDPASPLFKFKDLVAGTGTPESRYQQFLEARDFANTTARLERGEEGIVVPPELTNPQFVQGVSMILDPTLALPGIGEVFGAGKLATRAVGKGAQLTGRAIAGVARPLERVAGAAERMTAEALGMTPEGLRSTAATAGLAGALGIAPEAATLAAIPAGIRTTREAGEALARAGENLMTQPSRIGPLEAIGAAPGANLRQRMLGVVGQYGGDAALDASLRGLAGGIEGATVGTGLGFLSGGEEGAAAGLGSGLVQGAAGALGARGFERLTGKAAKEARAGDLGRFIDAQQDPTTKTLFERVRDQHGVDAASALMDLGALVKGTLGDIDINYLSDADFVEKYKGGRARGAQIEVGDRPVLDINADFIGRGNGDTPLYTLGHELFHALEKSKQLSGAATEIKDALVGRWIQEGDTIRKLADGALTDTDIEARFNEYRDKLAAGNPRAAADLAQYDTINKKADYIASEVAAEHFARLLAGQKPDALLKGFSGLTRQLMDAALTQNAIKSIANAAASIERTFGIKPTDSVLFPDLKQASPQLNAMLRDLVRARNRLDEKIMLESEQGGRVLKPEDAVNPLAARELVDMGVAEQMPDGTIRNLSTEEIRARDDKDMNSLRSITESIPGSRVVDGVFLGRFSPEQLSAIEQSQSVSSRMKDKIRGFNAAIDAGNSIHVVYSAALKRAYNRITKKYSPKYDSGIRVSEREVLPYAFYLSKADNPLVKVIDITKVRNALTKELAKDGSIGGLWENTDGFMGDLAKYFTNLDQKEGARRSYELFGDAKARFLGDFVNAQEKGGRKFVRDLRLDRIGSMSPMDFRARLSEDAIQLSNNRWMPAETIGDKSVINSEEGYRIISGAKHKLYGPDGKLIGIYDTQTQAERKADATQARLQPEVRQQQYPARDEGRQAAEAGGRNRAVGGQEGQAEGGAVRQAGDVRFMPEGKSAGLAVLDNELTLDLPKRPKVLDIANAFQNLFGKAIDYRKSKPADNAKLVNTLVQEIQRAVDLHPEAKGWYDENIKLTMDVMRDLDPDLAKPENDFMFKVILAATSDGNKVGPQFQQTWKEYSNWKNTGDISGDFVSGDRIENIRGNLMMFNEMVKAIGWEKTKDFFTRKGTVKEVRQALMDTFGWTKKEAQGIGSSELTDEVVPFAVVLGPKLGSFFNNLYGDFSSVTMDRWFMRTIGRLTGTQVEPLAGAKVREMRNNLRDAVFRLTPAQFDLLGIKRSDIKGASIDDAATTISGRFAKKALRDTAKQFAESGQTALEETRKFANALKKGLNPLVEAPVDGTHRRWIRERIAEVQKDLRSRGIELENADLQAVLWYLEKELYEKLNYRSKSGESDYASAASSLYQDVVGRPSDVYARGTGRVRAVGSSGRGDGMGAADAGQAPRQEVGGQRYMPSDTDYLSAVEKGDTQAAQRMVDEAAKAAGYTIGPVYHGTPTGGFNVFDKRMRGETSGVSRQAFSFTTDKKAAEGYSKRLGDEAVRLDAGLRVANDAMRRFDDDVAAQEYFSSKGYTSVEDGMLPEFDWGSIDDVPEFIKELRGHAKDLKPINPDLASSFVEAAKVMTSTKAVPEVKRVFLRIPDNAPVFQATPATLGQVMSGFSAEKQPTKSGIVELPGNERIYYVADSSQVKLADPVTKDAQGNVIPLSQRFKATSEDIRYMPAGDMASGRSVKDHREAMDLFEKGYRLYGALYDGMEDPVRLKKVTEIERFDPENLWAVPPRRVAAAIAIRNMPASEQDTKALQMLPKPRRSLDAAYQAGVKTRSQDPQYYDIPDYVGYDMARTAAFEMGREGAEPPRWVMAERIGKLPTEGRSKNFAEDKMERGVSVLRIVGEPQSDVGTYEMFNPGEKRYIAGWLVGLGSDGEPLLADAIDLGPVSGDVRMMPQPDSAMPGAYSFPGGYRAIPGKTKGSLRLYGPAGSLIGIASSLDEAQRILRRKAKQ